MIYFEADFAAGIATKETVEAIFDMGVSSARILAVCRR
jgi:hypothetical protein